MCAPTYSYTTTGESLSHGNTANNIPGAGWAPGRFSFCADPRRRNSSGAKFQDLSSSVSSAAFFLSGFSFRAAAGAPPRGNRGARITRRRSEKTSAGSQVKSSEAAAKCRLNSGPL